MRLIIDLQNDDEEDLRYAREMINRHIKTDYSSQYNKNNVIVTAVFKDIEEKTGNPVAIKDIIEKCKKFKLDETAVEEALEDMTRKGFVFEIKRGFLEWI